MFRSRTLSHHLRSQFAAALLDLPTLCPKEYKWTIKRLVMLERTYLLVEHTHRDPLTYSNIYTSKVFHLVTSSLHIVKPRNGFGVWAGGKLYSVTPTPLWLQCVLSTLFAVLNRIFYLQIYFPVSQLYEYFSVNQQKATHTQFLLFVEIQLAKNNRQTRGATGYIWVSYEKSWREKIA